MPARLTAILLAVTTLVPLSGAQARMPGPMTTEAQPTPVPRADKTDGSKTETDKAKDTSKKTSEKPPVVVDLTLKAAIKEAPLPKGLDGTPIGSNLRTLMNRIETAKNDDEVGGLLLRLRTPSIGPGKVHELRQAIADFQESGKPTVAFLDSASNVDYWVASAADQVVMPESGTLMLSGLAAEVTFFKNLFDKLGIEAEMFQVGDYKGAAEPFTRTKMSPEYRQQLTAVLTDQYDLLAEAIAEGRGVDQEQAKALIDGGPYTAQEALEAGLIDRIAYPDQIKNQWAKKLDTETVELDEKYGKPEPEDYSGFSGLMKMIQELSGQTEDDAESDDPKIAVIYATGMIQTGKSSPASIFGEAVMGSETIVEQIQKAESDKTVKAIVLRVDSPGGSALASDLIWRAVVESDKPIIASMSDTAASGGYYISMGCDRIFAEPGTLTGSIGVVGGKFALNGLLDKIGVTTDTVRVGENGALFSPFRPFSDEQEKAVRSLMEQTYHQFVSKAAEGRDMEFDALEDLAGGTGGGAAESAG